MAGEVRHGLVRRGLARQDNKAHIGNGVGLSIGGAMQLFVLDERGAWWKAILEAGARAGHHGKRIFRGEEVHGPGIGFLRCHARPDALQRNQRDYDLMATRLLMIQDELQVRYYENKSAQFAEWGAWMPATWRFTDLESAIAFLETADFPLVSKANEGASSKNVRILRNKNDAADHIRQLFGSGLQVDHCAGGEGCRSMQRGYVLLQRFIPHEVTWRVNCIGRGRAIFKRFCYPDKPVAQTGNVKPVMALDAETESLLEYADRFFQHAGTKWCALDVLRDGDQWTILETSLAWPWPSPGTCNEAPIFRTKRRWLDMFDVMFSEMASGAWSTE